MGAKKTLAKVLSGGSDSNIGFSDLCRLLEDLRFDRRVKGDHHMYHRDGVEEILNLQQRGNKAKAYQVKQVRDVIVKYHLSDD